MLWLIYAAQRKRLIQTSLLQRLRCVCSALHFSKVSRFERYWDISFLLQFLKKTCIMAKRQKNLLDIYTKVNFNTSIVEVSDSPISQNNHDSSNQLNDIENFK